MWSNLVLQVSAEIRTDGGYDELTKRLELFLDSDILETLNLVQFVGRSLCRCRCRKRWPVWYLFRLCYGLACSYHAVRAHTEISSLCSTLRGASLPQLVLLVNRVLFGFDLCRSTSVTDCILFRIDIVPYFCEFRLFADEFKPLWPISLNEEHRTRWVCFGRYGCAYLNAYSLLRKRTPMPNVAVRGLL